MGDFIIWISNPLTLFSIIFFMFGCVVGSFLNVVVYRLPLGMSVVSPPSHCPKCEYTTLYVCANFGPMRQKFQIL